jgi:hypothetical protein
MEAVPKDWAQGSCHPHLRIEMWGTRSFLVIQ